MDLQPKSIPSNDSENLEFAEPMEHQPLNVVMDPPEPQSTTVDLPVPEDAWLPGPVADIDRELAPATLKERLRDFYAALIKIPPPYQGRNSRSLRSCANSYLDPLKRGSNEESIFNLINRQSISDAELQPARIYIGLMFVGFSALSLMLVLLHSHTMYSGLTSLQQIQRYWEPYITFVCMGVAGMMMLGREAMRPKMNHSVNREKSTAKESLK